jgi:hypothetical protein
MRRVLAAIVMTAWPAVALAQTSTLAPLPPLPPIGLPLPDITGRLTPIDLPLTPIGLPPRTDPGAGRRGQHQRGVERHRPRFDSKRGLSHPSVVYFFHSYDWGIPESSRLARPGEIAIDPSPAPAVEERAMGTLRLELQPEGSSVQLFVDGLFMGTPDDFDNELTLPAGTHTIEARAPGYATLGFAVQIAADRAITYRGALQRVETAPPASKDAPPPRPSEKPAPPPPEPTTFYFIPGCYMGNVPPEAVVLPVNCDRTKAITRGAQR